MKTEVRSPPTVGESISVDCPDLGYCIYKFCTLLTQRSYKVARKKRKGVQESSLIFFQGLLSPSSGVVHPAVQKVKREWQEACMDAQGALKK